MKKYIYLASLLCGLALFFSSCDSGETGFDNGEFSSILYLKDDGEVNIEFYNVNKDITYSTIIGKGGTNPNAPGNAKLTVLTNEEMNQYNMEHGTTYEVMPSNCYSFPTEYTFTSKENSQNLDIILKKELGSLSDGVQYVLPIRLSSAQCSVNQKQNLLVLSPTVITPQIQLGKTGKTLISFAAQNAEVTTASVSIPVWLNMPNAEWSFGAEFESNESILSTLVQEYQATSGGGIIFSLLPAGNYDLSTVSFTGHENEKELTVSIDRKTLPAGQYLLPVRLKECIGMPFDVATGMYYIHVSITQDLVKQTIALADLSMNNSDGGENKLVDGSTSDTWQSKWYYATDSKPAQIPCDPTYGVYIDIKNITGISQVMNLKMSVAQEKNRPVFIQVYAGTSEANLQMIYSNENCYPNFSANKLEETGTLTTGKITMVRIAMLKSAEGADMRSLTYYSEGGGWSYLKNVSMAEIELFGY